MKRRFSLFTYPVMDRRAAEAELNRRAAAGWRLERLWLGTVASFVPAESPVCYCLDWLDPLKTDQPGYASLLAEAGWTRRALMTYQVIYEAPAGTTPIQTDSELEYQRFRKKVLRRMLLGGGALTALLLLIFALVLAVYGGRISWEDVVRSMAASSLSAVLQLTLPPLLVIGVLWLLRMALRLYQWKRCAREGEPFPVPGRVSGAVAAWCGLAVWLWVAFLLAALCLDILDGKVSMGWAVGLAIGGFLSLRIYPQMDQELLRRKWRTAWGAVVLAAVVLVAPWLTPDGLTAPLYPDQPMAEAQLLEGEDTWCVRYPDEASLLVSCSRWEEGTENDRLWLKGQCWHIRSDFLADRVAAEYLEELGPENQAPLPGYDQVWTAPEALRYANGNTADLWLLRRGSVIVRLETTPGLLEEQDLDGILTRMEGFQ